MPRRLLLGIILLGTALGACKSEIRGQFAWAATDDRDILEPELGLLTSSTYRIGRTRLYFFDFETVRWVYRLESGSVDARDRLVVALYEVKDTPTPVEVDLREVPIEISDGEAQIRQQYEPLPPGRYLIKVAHKEKVVDRVFFEVVPPGGPSAGADAPDLNEDDGLEPEPDEIIRYSS